MKRYAIFLAAALVAALSASADEKGERIIERMDDRMNFKECLMRIRIEDRKADGRERSMSARVEYAEGIGTRIEFTSPAKDKGKKILMSGDSMWMSAPTVSKPVRLSGKDAFMGTSFTNDDMMNFDKADDYESRVVAEDDGSWSLVMEARKASLPYPRIEARVGKDYLPISYAFFVRSGKEAKRVVYSDVRDLGGKPRPSLMTIVDLMAAGDESRVVFEEIRETRVDRARLQSAGFGK